MIFRKTEDIKMSFTMYVPTKTLFGAGMLNKLHEQRLPGRKALIVISNGKSTKANGYLCLLYTSDAADE